VQLGQRARGLVLILHHAVPQSFFTLRAFSHQFLLVRQCLETFIQPLHTCALLAVLFPKLGLSKLFLAHILLLLLLLAHEILRLLIVDLLPPDVGRVRVDVG